jgi:hypothetical protein
MAISARLNKTTPYTKGELMTLTVTTDAADRDQYVDTPGTISISIPGVGQTTVTFALRNQVADIDVTVTDDAGRQWTQVSKNDTVSVHTAIA